MSELPGQGRATGMLRFERAVVRALAETLYPERESHWPSWKEARIVEEIDHFLAGTTASKRRLLRLLLLFTYLFPALKPPFRFFPSLIPAARLETMKAWDQSRWGFLNLCASSLRILFNLAYLSNSDVKQKIGEETRGHCRSNIRSRRLKQDRDGRWEGVSEFSELQGVNIREEVDFVVVGSGPGGATVARSLTEQGRSVIVVEEGPFHRPEEHDASAIRTLRDIYAEQGLRFARGVTPIRTLQARALGGTSLVNAAICWRAPEWVFEEWRGRFGIEGVNRKTLAPHYETAEREMNVHPTEEENWGRKGTLFRDGCAGVGVSSAPTNRGMVGCRGCSHCFYGCHINAKQSMDRCTIPNAIEHGARFFTSSRVEELIVERGRVAGVRAKVLNPITKSPEGDIEIRARAVILAAGVMASPLILLKNDLPWRSPAIGRNLCFHNGVAAAGVFDEPVEPWRGGTQDWHTEAYVGAGIHMEVLWVNSALMTARTRGFGVKFQQTLEELSHTAFWCISIRGETRGRLSANRSWEPTPRFDLTPNDTAMLKRGIDLMVDHFFAAGARAVRPGVAGAAPELKSNNDVQTFKQHTPKATELVVGGNHVFGTCAMGADPRRAVVDSHHMVHGVPDLYVCDTSVYPSQSAVNPQLTLMAMAGRLGQNLNNRY